MRQFWRSVSRILFGVLVVHFVLVYCGPEWLALPGSRTYLSLKKRGRLLPFWSNRRTPMVVRRDNRVFLRAGSGRERFDITNITIDARQLQVYTGRYFPFGPRPATPPDV